MSVLLELKMTDCLYYVCFKLINLLVPRRMMYNRVMVMVFNATFNNISVISWRSVLLVEETGENLD
jgi:hypothetical protein